MNGRFKHLAQRGASKTEAKNRLKEAAAKLAKEAAGRQINENTRIELLALHYLAEIKRKVDDGTRSFTTYDIYRGTVNNEVVPRLGALAGHELDVFTAYQAIMDVDREVGRASAKKFRTVLSGICKFGVLHGAMEINPIRQLDDMFERSKDAEPVRALEPAQRKDFLTKFDGYCDKKAANKVAGVRALVWQHLKDITLGQLGTGVRIGEVTALLGPDIDIERRTVHFGYHLVRVAGKGIVRMPGRKGGEPPLTLVMPSWSVPMWTRVKEAAGEGIVFPAWSGGWLDPSNLTKRIRSACDAIGYEWMSSRMLRHTVGTHLTDNGHTSNEAGDQLGNTAEVVDKHYRRRQVANRKIAHTLESMFPEAEAS
ncbi:site-specific integrase [Amycolatopsis sp. CA-230715]|uniref:site-specific integrase n=1 Tax=Amycolatopsis sp. CA-230715 TaxID=2745196 RepID=UPI001C034562|nr:tyrosine-type recombinase/integrase [Amycolatopsis sp. CA-230715]QWF81165.1 hypothetical protein HUW46_04591 [Amycolatopsis sp. CA-230715]